MDRRFLRSREFLVAAGLAGLLVAAGLIVATSGFFPGGFSHGGCTVDDPRGTAVEPTVREEGPTRSGDEVVRTVTYTLDPSTAEAGRWAACTDVGTLQVAPSPDGDVHLEARLSNHGDGAVEAVDQDQPRVRFARSGGALHLAADHPNPTHVDTATGTHTTTMDVTLQVPDGMVPSAEFSADEGAVEVRDVDVADLELAVDEGEAQGSGLAVGGDADVSADEGSVDLALDDVASGSWSVAADEGELDLDLPGGDRYGYDVVATADEGEITVDIGPTEHRDRTEDDGTRVEARSQGYDGKAVQVQLEGAVDEGDLSVIAS